MTGFPDTWIQVCGPLVARVDGSRREQDLGSRQVRELTAFLVVNRRRSVARDELVEALWPDGPPPRAAATLNTLLSRIRRALGHDRLVGRGALRLDLPADAWIDIEVGERNVNEAASLVAQGDFLGAWAPARVALRVARRGFLPDVVAPWADEWRRHVENIRVLALESMAACGIGIGGPELGSAERAGRELIELAPLRETGYRYLIEYFAARDDVAAALQVYDDLRIRLREELGVAPSRHAQDLHGLLLARSAPR